MLDILRPHIVGTKEGRGQSLKNFWRYIGGVEDFNCLLFRLIQCEEKMSVILTLDNYCYKQYLQD